MSTSSTEQRYANSARAFPSTRRVPSLTVVVTASRSLERARAILPTIVPVCVRCGAEVVVIHATSGVELDNARQELPTAKWIAALPGSTSADMRRLALLRCTTDIIAFADESGIVDKRLEQLCQRWGTWSATGVRPGAHGSAAPALDLLSIIVPVCNNGASVVRALEALTLSDLSRDCWELIVVDSGSTDDTAFLAAPFADTIVRLPRGPYGPGYARNRGVDVALGRSALFTSPEVMLRANTLSRTWELLDSEPALGALFGSYDTSPVAPQFVSQYRNLLQHFYHQQNVGDASTFWSACGAVRLAVFEDAGGYDEWHFLRRQLEDLELGQRIRRIGHRIALCGDVEVTSLKRWTLRGIIREEIFDRGVPWMRLVNKYVVPSKGRGARSLRVIRKSNVFLTWLGTALMLATLVSRHWALLAASLACLTLVLVNNGMQLRFFKRQRGIRFAVASIPLDLVYYAVSGFAFALGWLAKEAFGEPGPGAAAEAFRELAIETWPPVPIKRFADRPMATPAPVADIALPNSGSPIADSAVAPSEPPPLLT